MKYDAITLDTNIFTNNGYALEHGLLKQLEQFKQGSVKFVLSEIVVREVFRHLEKENTEIRSNLDKAINRAKNKKLLAEKTADKLLKLTEGEPTPKKLALERINTFRKNTGFQAIKADGADISELIKRYFNYKPPFENNNEKRKEFPDAIALLTLEKYAKENNIKILAVSKDKGWIDFAASSKWIDVNSDFSKALSELQLQLKEAQSMAESFLSNIPDSQKELLNAGVAEGVADLYGLYAEADSDMYYEEEEVRLELKSFNLIDDDGSCDFNVVQIGSNKIVIDLPMFVEATAEADFSFSIRDSIDKDYVGIGSNTCVADTDFLCSALVTLEWEPTDGSPEIEITNVELINTPDSVDFGFIRPDFSDEYYEE
ncbi:MAG TPA: PIN domain-containing protein [Alphaproteobacteria bacterium]|nr:PIN domain-containing protein [Alphaproteobacteria bacterium]